MAIIAYNGKSQNNCDNSGKPHTWCSEVIYSWGITEGCRHFHCAPLGVLVYISIFYRFLEYQDESWFHQ